MSNICVVMGCRGEWEAAEERIVFRESHCVVREGEKKERRDCKRIPACHVSFPRVERSGLNRNDWFFLSAATNS